MTKNDKQVERGRWTSPRKMETVLRLLRGEELDAVSRELSVKASMISLLLTRSGSALRSTE